MNILKKTSILLLLTAVFHSPLMAQKKLDLANECFNAKAYYLASRYYQEFFGPTNDCHPDRLKMAQSFAATGQSILAESNFNRHLSCQKNSAPANLAYGKFLVDNKNYQQAIPYFEKLMETEPETARQYILACRTALGKSGEQPKTILVNQKSESIITQNEVFASKSATTNSSAGVALPAAPSVSSPELTASVFSGPSDEITRATNKINLFDAMKSADSHTEPRTTVPDKPIKVAATVKERQKTVSNSTFIVEKTISPYGVRLGTYKNVALPDLTSIRSYGTVEKKQWNGKTILFLVDFSSRAAAEAALTVARQENFRSATLVEKLASGRMKSIR